MKLDSDFCDYYDWAFSGTGRVFARLSKNSGPTKREQFSLLESAGYNTPPHGTLNDVAGRWWDSEKHRVQEVVAYEDESAHCGEGKRLLAPMHYCFDGCISPVRLAEQYRLGNLYCSAFLRGSYGLSWRLLFVGCHQFWIEYKSASSWMSNQDGDCEVIGVGLNAGPHPQLRWPLFAIDFIVGSELYAVDLNIAPGLRWSGVEKYLLAHEVVGAIESAVYGFGREGQS